LSRVMKNKKAADGCVCGPVAQFIKSTQIHGVCRHTEIRRANRIARSEANNAGKSHINLHMSAPLSLGLVLSAPLAYHIFGPNVNPLLKFFKVCVSQFLGYAGSTFSTHSMPSVSNPARIGSYKSGVTGSWTPAAVISPRRIKSTAMAAGRLTVRAMAE